MESTPNAVRVLVVDDNADYIELVSAVLRRLGLETYVATTGQEAIALAGACRPDIALVDIAMPAVTGLDVARQLRTQPGLEELLIIAVTGMGDEVTRNEADAAGFNLYLVKPVSLEVLRDVLAIASTRVLKKGEKHGL